MHRDIYALAISPLDFENIRRIVSSLRDIGGENEELFARISAGLADSFRLDLAATCETYPKTGEVVAVSSGVFRKGKPDGLEQLAAYRAAVYDENPERWYTEEETRAMYYPKA